MSEQAHPSKLDPQCTCRHRPTDWGKIKLYVRTTQGSMAFLGGFLVVILVASANTGNLALYFGELIAAAILTAYVVMWYGQTMTGHSLVCASRLAFLRLTGRRASLKQTAGLAGTSATPADLVPPTQAAVIANRDKLLLVLGAMFSAFGLFLYIVDKADKLQSLKLIAIGALLALPSLLPATKGKAYHDWPKPYQIAAKLYCVLALIGFITNG